jgi:alcohol dehydrogenase class IV
MLPTLALVDPTLTYSLPPGLTACTGLDALTQVLEPYVSCRANPLTDSLCRMGLEKVGFGLRTAYYQGDNPGARETMSLVSLWGGLALANAGLGAVHGFAGPLGGMYSAPHGAVCASLLAPVWQANIERLRRETPRHPALDRYQNAARWLTGNSEATVEDGSRWLVELVRELEIPPLSHWGVHAAEIPEIATKSAQTSSMKGNPIGLTLAELETALSAALD